MDGFGGGGGCTGGGELLEVLEAVDGWRPIAEGTMAGGSNVLE